MAQHIEQATVERALSGDDDALQQLIRVLTPVIQTRVGRCVLHWNRGQSDVRREVEDLTQDVFAYLFADGARALRSWQPEKGMSLQNFIGLIAQRQATSHYRAGKRSAWREDAAAADTLEAVGTPTPGPEQQVSSQDTLSCLLGQLREELSPLGWQLFEMLYVREQAVEEVREATGLSADAVYAWRSRLRKLAREKYSALSEFSEPVRIPS